MNLYEAIFVRKSVHSYLPDSLNPELLERIRDHFRELTGLFGSIGTDITILDNRKGQQRMLSLFSVKAPYYMIFYSENAPRCLMNVGYLMQQMVLFLCQQGLGSCYLSSRRVRKEYQEKDGMKLVAILAFGKAKESPVRKRTEADRKSLDELCVYKEVPRQWIGQLLDAARMAPSESNSQPWRFVVFDNRIHIFSKKHKAEQLKKWDEVNFGILFANLMTAAEELWLDVDLIRLEDISQKNFPNSQYVLSAVMKL